MRYFATAVAFLLAADAAQAAPEPPTVRAIPAHAGGPAIEINGNVHAPILFSGNNQFGRDEVLLEEIKLAAEAGIPFFTVNMSLQWRVPDREALATVAKFCEAHPDTYYMLRLWVGPDAKWLNEHPDEAIAKYGGERLNYAPPSSAVWLEEARRQLDERLRLILDGAYGHRCIGVALHNLHTAEWFYPETDSYMDHSPANLAAWRRWLKETYQSDKRLREAWGDEGVTLDTARLPDPGAREDASWGSFRFAPKHQPTADLARFQSETIADAIDALAATVKEASSGRLLAGTFYGYTFELNNNTPRSLAHSGHLALSRLLESPHVDFILAPYSYYERQLGQPGNLHLPLDSITLHGKLPIMEEDTYTHLAQPPGPNVTAPGWGQRTQSLQETLHITRRNYGMFLSHGAGMWFFDLLSDGRWNSADFWKSTALLRRIAAETRGQQAFGPQVAVVASERSVALMRDTTHPLLQQALSISRHEWQRLGTSVGYYLQQDLPRLPESARVVALLNPYTMTEAEEAAVDALLEAGKTVIIFYAAGLDADPETPLAKLEEWTGLQIEARMDDVAPVVSSPMAPASLKIGNDMWAPRLIITRYQGDVVARYEETHQVAGVALPKGNGVLVYSAVPRLPLEALREICRRAGVHFYRDSAGAVYRVGNYLFAHGKGEAEENVTFRWPTQPPSVTRIAPGDPVELEITGAAWQDALSPGETKIYRIGE